MQVAPDAGFSGWFFTGAEVQADVPEDAEVGDGVYVARNLGVEIQAHWKDWLGSILIDEIAHGGLLLYVTARDASFEALQKRREDVLNGLLLQGIPEHLRAISLTGAHVAGRLEIQQFSRSRELQAVFEAEEFRLTLAAFHRAVLIGKRLREIQDAANGRGARLIRTARVLLNANRTSNSHGERFHQLVRALDGLVKTRQGTGCSDFAHRVQTFTVASQDTWATLTEMYDVRGAVEHLKDPASALAVTLTDQDAKYERVNRLTRQADALARCAVCRILESEPLYQSFMTEESIDRFWALQNHERSAVWGRRVRLDIRKIQ